MSYHEMHDENPIDTAIASLTILQEFEDEASSWERQLTGACSL